MKWLLLTGIVLNLTAALLGFLAGKPESAFFHLLLSFVLIWVS